MQDRPLYPIGIVAEILNVHPETVRVWERHGIIHPKRRSGKRFYSEGDLNRLRFIKKLMGEGLNIPAISHYLKLYPCWQRDNCPVCMHRSDAIGCAKPCWKEEGTYCEVSYAEDPCAKCEFGGQEKQCQPTAVEATK